MFEKLKKLFQRKKPEAPKATNYPTIGSRIPVPPPPPRARAAYVRQPAPAPATATKDDSGDFATSFAIGMMTNNALLGGVVGGSFAGGLMGDIARDGAIGDAAPSQAAAIALEVAGTTAVRAAATTAGVVTTAGRAAHRSAVTEHEDPQRGVERPARLFAQVRSNAGLGVLVWIRRKQCTQHSTLLALTEVLQTGHHN